jgi:hypothetical protein
MTNFGPLRSAVGFLVLLVLAVLAVPQAASASAVLYTFTTTEVLRSGLTLTSSFSFEVPAIITASTSITSLLSASNTGSFWTGCGPISSVDFSSPASGSPFVQEEAGSCAIAFGFPAPIDTFGTFAASVNQGTLTISQTPEPATGLLFGGGLLLFGIIARRKQLHARRIGLIGAA